MSYTKLCKVSYTTNLQTEKNQHKVPFEKDWQNKSYSAEDAEKWILEGYGVGYNIANSPHKVAVIDIDCKSVRADYIVKKLGEAGALVCETPRGYHIFVKRMNGMPNDSKGVVIRVDEHYEECEFYSGSSARNIVLPIANTPRANIFGGIVLYADGKVVGEPVTVWAFEEYLENLKEIHGWCLYDKNAKPVAAPTLKKETIEKWNSVLGCDFRTCTKEQICEIMANTPEGRRNDVMLSLSLIWVWREFGDWEPFIQACRAAWHNEPRYVDKNVMEALKGAEKWIKDIKKYTSKPLFCAGVYEEDPQLEQDDSDEGLFDAVMRICFNNEAKYAKWMGENYILYEGFAYKIKNLVALAANKGIKISEFKAKVLFDSLADFCEENQNAIILRPRSIDYKTNLGFVVPVEIENEKGVIISGNGEMKFVKTSDLQDVYFMKNASFRKIDKKIFENPSECLGVLIKSLRSFFENYSDEEVENAFVAAVLASATPASRAVLFILGESGAGKSTLSVFIQKMINSGNIATIENNTEVRNIYAPMIENRVVGFEETDTLSAEVLGILKQGTTYGSVETRKYYEQTETVNFTFENNYVIATTDVTIEKQDILRRAICIRLQLQNRQQKPENILLRLIENSLPYFIVGYMFLCKDFVSYDNITDKFHEGINKNYLEGLPPFLQRAQKVDVAYAYWYFCNKLGVSEEVAEYVWHLVRHTNLGEMTGVWENILIKLEADPKFREQAEKGMTARDLVKEALGYNNRQASIQLSKTVNQVKPVLLERGIEIKVEEIKDEKSRSIKLYRLIPIGKASPAKVDNTLSDTTDKASPAKPTNAQSTPASPSMVSEVSQIPWHCRKQLLEDYINSEFDVDSDDNDTLEKISLIRSLAEYVLLIRPFHIKESTPKEEKEHIKHLYNELKMDIVRFYNEKYEKNQ